jgi:predicted nucleic-acid-binding Zn-ribbon protein
MSYKVLIQIQQVGKDEEHSLIVGRSYEAGRFNSEEAARIFVENELLVIRQVNMRLRNACRSTLRFLDTLGTANLMASLKSLETCLRMMKKATSCRIPPVDDSCPKCGAGSDQREFIRREFLDIEAVHAHYTCLKCGSEVIEEFTLTDVFVDEVHLADAGSIDPAEHQTIST